MKKIIKIKDKGYNYKILIEKSCIDIFFNSSLFKTSDNFIIIDEKLSKLIKKKLVNKNNVKFIEIPGSEKIKSVKFYWNIISKLLNSNINRDSNIIAIGGGSIGDLSGFIASTILRGVNFILIPTTLLSQVDSSIGGKNGINSSYGKNLIGTFYQPNLVIIDPLILNTLPSRQIISGYAEIVKHALISDKKFYLWLKKNYKGILNLDNDLLISAIEKSIKIKASYVKKDEKEKLINSSSRAMLNFGHTFGHAIETANEYKASLTHGEAISIGMITASKISVKLKGLKKNELEDIINHFNNVGLPTKYKTNYGKKIFKIISSDKKNQNKKINLILLKKIGKSYFERDLSISKVKKLIN